MQFLQDCITYVRRILKTPSNSSITNELIIDYINRFGIEINLRMQLFDFKKKYQFQTVPGVDRYNMPLYSVQTSPTGSAQTIAMFPVYQGFMSPCCINGIPVKFSTQKEEFFNLWPNVVQYATTVAVGNNSVGPYTITLPILPNNSTPINPPINALVRGHIDLQGIINLGQNVDPPIVTSAQAIGTNGTIARVPVTSVDSSFFITTTSATGQLIEVADSGQFLNSNVNLGLLMTPGKAPNGNTALPGGYSSSLNTINYLTGEATIQFPSAIPSGVNINVEYRFFQSGLPRGVLFYDNTITLRSIPAQSYLVELDAYLTPAAFLTTEQAIPFGYMTEYWARGAARKILSDTGDTEQFQFYEPFFIEQEQLVWKRSQRQWTATRTQSLYSQGSNLGQTGFNNLGGSQ